MSYNMLENVILAGNIDTAESIWKEFDNAEKQKCFLHFVALKMVWDDQRELVVFALDRGIDINSQDADGNTALHVAVENEHKELIALLLDRNANASLPNKNDKTPADLLQQAIFFKAQEKIAAEKKIANIAAIQDSCVEPESRETQKIESRETQEIIAGSLILAFLFGSIASGIAYGIVQNEGVKKVLQPLIIACLVCVIVVVVLDKVCLRDREEKPASHLAGVDEQQNPKNSNAFSGERSKP